jgi:hypothetical protein
MSCRGALRFLADIVSGDAIVEPCRESGILIVTTIHLSFRPCALGILPQTG